MKTPPFNPLTKYVLACTALGLAPGFVQAQYTHPPNRFSFGSRLPFNVSATFENSVGTPAQTDPGPPVGYGLARNHDDGYVRVDSDGNAGGLTWNWGYRDADQVPGDGNLYLHSASAGPPEASHRDADHPQLGFEFAWLREVHRTENYAWGFLLAFNYTHLTINDARPRWASAQRLTDAYSLGGLIPPGDPRQPGWQYQGSYDVPGLLIDDTPLRRSSAPLAAGAQTAGTRRLDADAFGWRLGPWLEFPLTRRLGVSFGGGLSLAWVDSQFEFDETTHVPGAVPTRAQGSLLPGVYAETRLHLTLNRQWSLYAGFEFQHLAKFSQRVGQHSATLDLGQT
jgi:hypothetical protein